MRVGLCVCVCRSSCDRSGMSECTRVCVSSSVIACVCLGVCSGVYLYKDGGGVLDLRVRIQTAGHAPPSIHSFSPLSKAFPSKPNERSLDKRRRRVISLFEYLTSAPSFFLPLTLHVAFVKGNSAFTHNSSFVGAHAETLLHQMKAGMCGLRCQNRNFLPAREASVCWFYKEVRFIVE